VKPVLVVFGKEVVDNLRDRRTLLTALGIAVLAPLLFTALIAFAIDVNLDDSDSAVEVAVVGAEHAPNLIAFLERHRVTVLPGPEHPETAVAEREVDVVLVIPERYAEQFSAGTPAAVRIVHDSSRRSGSGQDARRLERLLDGWGGTIARLRLQARGVNPEVIDPLAVERADVASPAAQAVALLGMIPYLIVFSVFMGGFYLAIDTTAGEREQGSLEPLLTQPARRADLVLGKLAATCLFSLVTLVAVCLSMGVAVDRLPLAELGMSLDFGVGTAFTLALAVSPLTLLAAALLTVIASFTQSFKEAQTWLSPAIMVPILPLVLLGVLSPEPTVVTMLVPSLSQALLINGVVAGEPVSLSLTLISVGSTLALGVVLSAVAVRLYRREGLLG
jgi:sodium transport system permease protein